MGGSGAAALGFGGGGGGGSTFGINGQGIETSGGGLQGNATDVVSGTQGMAFITTGRATSGNTTLAIAASGSGAGTAITTMNGVSYGLADLLSHNSLLTS